MRAAAGDANGRSNAKGSAWLPFDDPRSRLQARAAPL